MSIILHKGRLRKEKVIWFWPKSSLLERMGEIPSDLKLVSELGLRSSFPPHNQFVVCLLVMTF